MLDTSSLRNPAIEWNTGVSNLQSLLQMLTVVDRLKVSFEIVKNNTEYFVQYHPDVSWLYEYLELSTQFIPIEYQKNNFKIYNHTYEDNSIISFLRGVGLLDGIYRQVVNKQDLDLDGMAVIADGISEILGARLYDFRVKKYPQSFISEQDIEILDEQEAISRVNTFKNSDERQKLIHQLWSSVADAIEIVADN